MLFAMYMKKREKTGMTTSMRGRTTAEVSGSPTFPIMPVVGEVTDEIM